MADRRAEAAHLVDRDARADPGPADEDPAVGLAALDGQAEPLREVRVVVGGSEPSPPRSIEVVAEAGAAEPADQLVLEAGPGMIGGERDAHGRRIAAAVRRNGSPSTPRRSRLPPCRSRSTSPTATSTSRASCRPATCRRGRGSSSSVAGSSARRSPTTSSPRRARRRPARARSADERDDLARRRARVAGPRHACADRADRRERLDLRAGRRGDRDRHRDPPARGADGRADPGADGRDPLRRVDGARLRRRGRGHRSRADRRAVAERRRRRPRRRRPVPDRRDGQPGPRRSPSPRAPWMRRPLRAGHDRHRLPLAAGWRASPADRRAVDDRRRGRRPGRRPVDLASSRASPAPTSRSTRPSTCGS